MNKDSINTEEMVQLLLSIGASDFGYEYDETLDTLPDEVIYAILNIDDRD